MSPVAGQTTTLLFDHYVVERVLGRGAMGVVYLARDARIGRRVALKTVQDRTAIRNAEQSIAFYERFRREAEMCGALVHPNIVTLYEVGYEGKRISYLAMEYVDGESLLSLMRRRGRLSVDATFRIVGDVLAGLTCAHDRGIVHRDVKPANILISTSGESKLTDFGIAREDGGTQMTSAGQLLGTPHYMPPEHIAGRPVTPQSDLFSLGVVAFEMLTGRRPFDGPDIFDVLYKIVNVNPPEMQSIAPEVPYWAAAFVAKLMARQPHQRFISAESARRELLRLAELHKGQARALSAVPMPIQRTLSAEETPTAPIESDQVRGPSFVTRLQSHVRSALGLGVIAALLGGYTAGLLWLSRRAADQQPRAVVTAEQRDASETKRRLLSEASLLYDAGAYREALARYAECARRFPESAAAAEGLRRARIAAGVKVEEVEASLGAPSARVSAFRVHKPDEPRKGLLASLRRWLRS